MPGDLLPTPIITVIDRDAVNLPFSKGIMATSILATGVDTPTAHHLAKLIERDLIARDVREISVDELATLATMTIAGQLEPDQADRYARWRLAKRAGRPFVVVLCGAPGVGKSTLATRLAVRLGVDRVIASDAIREVLRNVIPPTVLPELHVSTFEAVDPDEPPLTSFRRQARVVSDACAAVVGRLVVEGMNVIVDGVHLLPGVIRRDLARRGSGVDVVEFLLTLEDERLHRIHLQRRMQRQPERAGHRHLDQFPVIRRIQADLSVTAAREGLHIHDVGQPGTLTQRVVDAIVAAQAGTS
jgi:2-phosphoglycerate kinase